MLIYHQKQLFTFFLSRIVYSGSPSKAYCPFHIVNHSHARGTVSFHRDGHAHLVIRGHATFLRCHIIGNILSRHKLVVDLFFVRRVSSVPCGTRKRTFSVTCRMCVTTMKKNSTVKIRSGSDDVLSVGTSCCRLCRMVILPLLLSCRYHSFLPYIKLSEVEIY